MPALPPNQGASRYLTLAVEAAGRAIMLLALPFQTWYRVAHMRQAIRDLGHCDDRLLRDIAGQRSRIACLELLASNGRNEGLRRNDW